MSKLAFFDETIRDPTRDVKGYYQLTAALVDGPEVADLRRATVAAAPAQGFHASNLAAHGQATAVELMLQHVAESPCWNLITVCHTSEAVATGAGPSQEEARQRCLAVLLEQVDRFKIGQVVADSREAIVGRDPQARNRKDQATLQELRRQRRVDRHMTLRHMHDSDEQLLWVPDAVGWAFRQQELRGNGHYWQLVASVTTVHRL